MQKMFRTAAPNRLRTGFEPDAEPDAESDHEPDHGLSAKIVEKYQLLV